LTIQAYPDTGASVGTLEIYFRLTGLAGATSTYMIYVNILANDFPILSAPPTDQVVSMHSQPKSYTLPAFSSASVTVSSSVE